MSTFVNPNSGSQADLGFAGVLQWLMMSGALLWRSVMEPTGDGWLTEQ